MSQVLAQAQQFCKVLNDETLKYSLKYRSESIWTCFHMLVKPIYRCNEPLLFDLEAK